MDAQDTTHRIRERLRLLILRSPLTQRAVENRVGFSRGHLSQLLAGTLDLKYWHLLAILHAIEVEPSEFFAALFPRRRHPALEVLDDVACQTEEGSLTYELTRLFASGIETLNDLGDRLVLCEEALDELADLGRFGARDDDQGDGKA